MKYLKTFESYEYENFTLSDMQFCQELYDEGITDPAEIAQEMDGVWSSSQEGDEETVKQMLASLRKSGDID